MANLEQQIASLRGKIYRRRSKLETAVINYNTATVKYKAVPSTLHYSDMILYENDIKNLKVEIDILEYELRKLMFKANENKDEAGLERE